MGSRVKLLTKHNYTFVLIKTRPFFFIVCYEWGKYKKGKVAKIKIKKTEGHIIEKFIRHIDTTDNDIVSSITDFCETNNISFRKFT